MAGTGDGKADKQRRYERIPFSADVVLVDRTRSLRCPGRSIDISRGGVGFFAAHFFPPGARLRLGFHLTRDGPRQPIFVDVIVVRAQAETSGAIMGAMFETELSPRSEPVLCDVVDRQT